MNITFCLEFLRGCIYFRNPNPVLCYDSIWKEIGCLSVGTRYPSKLSKNNLQLLEEKSLM